MKEISEHTIVQLNTGSERIRATAMKAIFNAYIDDMLRFALRLTNNPEVSEEIVQDAFLHIWRHQRFENQGHIEAHLHLIVRSLAFKYRSKIAKQHTQHTGFVKEKTAQPLVDPHQETLEQLNETIDHAIRQLDPTEQRIFQLTYRDGYTVEEASHALNLSRATYNRKKANLLDFLRKRKILGAGHILLAFLSLIR